MWKFYLTSAARNIRKMRFFSALNIAGLSIGVCIFLLACQFYNYERSFNQFHTQLPFLYRVNIVQSAGINATTVPTLGPLMQKDIPGVSSAIRFADNFNDGAVVSFEDVAAGQPVRSFREEGVVFTDESFLQRFSFPLIAGSNGLAETNTVVITAVVARQFFGSDDAIGKTLHLHNQFSNLPVKVVGVLADIPDQSDIRFRYLLSIHILENPGYTEGSDWARLDSWGNDSYTTYVRLDEKTDASQVARKATELWKQYNPHYQRTGGAVSLQPVSAMHLGQSLHDRNPTYGSLAMTWTILVLGVLVLVIAWINYINFSTADALNRAKEIGIHKTLGSSRRQIVLRYVAESAVLNAAGFALAIGLTGITQGLFNYLTQRPLSFDYLYQPGNLAFIASIFFSGSLLSGGYVGWLLSRFRPVTAMHLNDPGGWGYLLGRKGLVVFQLTVSSVFTACTLIAYQQIGYMKAHDLGMDVSRLVVIDGPALKDSSYKIHALVFRNELQRLPFVEKLSCTGSVPGLGFAHNFAADGITGSRPRKGDNVQNYYVSIVDDQFFPTYGIPLLKGRNYTMADAGRGFNGTELIVNETAARALGYEPAQAIGQAVNWGKRYTICGVVKDYHHRSLKDVIEPIIYVAGQSNACYTIKMDPARLTARLSAIGAIYEKLFPGNTFVYRPMREAYDKQYADQERTGAIALSLSLLVIVIAGFGLVGLAAFTARRRVKEMGIRKVLGASVPSLFVQMSRDFVWLATISLLLATPIAWVVSHRWLETFAYRIRPGWDTFALTALFSLVIILVTISYHTMRAALVNPARQLRTD